MNTLPVMVDPWLRNLLLLSCKGGLLALSLGIGLLLLRRHVSPAWRHGLWLLVLLRFALPDIGTSSLSLNQVTELPAVQLSLEPVMVSPPVAPPRDLQVNEEPDAPMKSPPASPPVVVKEVPSPPVVTEPGAVRPAWTRAQWLLGIWGSGTLAVLAVMLMLHLRLLRCLRRDASSAPAAVVEVLNEACELAGISQPPRLIVTEAVRSPALFGVFYPAILLPRDLGQVNDPAALKLVFLHELAHLGRKDLWAQIVTSIILAVHWFNPAVWWAARRMRVEAEMAADARALACTDAAEAHRFGAVLLGFASRATAGWMLWLAVATVLGISENKHDLRRRIEALKDIARGRRTRWMIGLSAFSLLAITGLTKAPAQTQIPPAKETASASTTPESNGLTISGMVVDETGKPVAGASCALSLEHNHKYSSRNAVSDREGRFTFQRVPLAATSLSLSASHKGYAGSGRTQFNGNSQTKDHRIVLPSLTWVTGRVTDKRDGKPIKDARVFYGREMSPALGTYRWFFPSVRTSETGEYRLPVKTADIKGLIIRAWAQDMSSHSVLMDLEKKGSVFNAALEPLERIPGKLVNAEGQPVKGGLVWVIEDRFVLDEREEPFTAEWLTSKDKRRKLAEGKTFVSLSYSGEGGIFKLHDVDPLLKGRQWVAAIHPEDGIAFFPAKDLASGMIVKLHRWASFKGLVRQPEGTLLKNSEIELTAGISSLETPGSGLPPALNHYVNTTTDAEGVCEVKRILPNCSLLGLKTVGGEFRGVDPVRIGSGPLSTRTITQRASLRPPLSPDARTVRGRIILPAGRSFSGKDYLVSTTLIPASGKHIGASPRPDAEGRFVLSLPPDTYKLTVMAMPHQQPGMGMAPQGMLHLQFKVVADPEQKPYDLVDVTLEESDFAFQPFAASSYEVLAEGGISEGENGRVEILAADNGQNPLPNVRIKAVDLVDQARQPLGVREIVEAIPAVTTDGQGRASLTFPRSLVRGERAAGVLVTAIGRDGGVSRESSVMDATRTRISVASEIPVDVHVNPAIASWMVSNWVKPSNENPVTGGTHLSGTMQAFRNTGLLIRGRTADGTTLFSPVLKVSPESKVFRTSVNLTPAVTWEGKINPVKAGQSLQGWVAAQVISQSEAELGEVVRGYPPMAVWHAWARVHADGTFVLKDLPRGRISLFAMGQGWQCGQYNARDSSTVGSSRLSTSLDAETTMEQSLKILLPDGTPAADATVSRTSLTGSGVLHTSMLLNVIHDVAPEDGAEYAGFKRTGIPGLRGKTNAQGEVTMTYLPPGKAKFDVHWLDAKTRQPRHARCEATISQGEPRSEIVTVVDVRP